MSASLANFWLPGSPVADTHPDRATTPLLSQLHGVVTAPRVEAPTTTDAEFDTMLTLSAG